MAILKEEENKFEAQEAKLNRQKQKESKLEEQYDILKRREEFGEAWKYERGKVKKEKGQNVFGDIEIPTLYGFEDANTYFDPVKFYGKESSEDVTVFNYETYFGSLDTYRERLKKIDSKIAKDNEFLSQFMEAEISEDEIEDITDLSELKKLVEDKEKQKKKKAGSVKKNKAPSYLHKFLAKWTSYFQSVVPVYDKYICSSCGRPLSSSEFFITYDEGHTAFLNEDGNIHSHICKKCAKRLFEFLFYERAQEDGEMAMKWFCSYMNWYFDTTLYFEAKENMKKGKNKNHIVEEYYKLISSKEWVGKVFLDSANIGTVSIIKTTDNQLEKPEDFQLEWTKEELDTRRLVLKMVGYDPFDYETEEDKKSLYKDLLGMLDTGMEYDVLKVNAAVEIVSSFLKIRKINRKYNEIEQASGAVSELKALSDLKNKELTAITQFSRDNGFGERYAISKAKGENTFTGIMAKMLGTNYEDAIVNMYDIATSESINQAMEASTKAIFSQLGLSDSEVYKTCQDQLKKILDLQHKNSSLQEQIRQLKYELAKGELEMKAEEVEREKNESY